MVMHLLVAVEVDRPGEIRVRLILVDLLFEQQGVGADDDETALRISPRRFPADPCGSAARRRRSNDGRAAFVGRIQGVCDGDALVQDLVRVVDLAATRAVEIAAEERLQHHDERILLAAGKMLADDVAADLGDLLKGIPTNDYLLPEMPTTCGASV
jgi:hypothetical protein